MSGTRTPTTSRTTTFRPRSLRTGHEHLPRKQRVARLFCSTHAKRRTRSVSPLHTSFSSDSSHDYVYGPSGTPIEQVNEATGAATYLYTDQLGSVVMEADQSGTVTASQAYAPYGEVASTSGTWTTPFGYAGGYTDPTGLIYLINRYYDAQTGQFVSVDPLVGMTGAAYGYVGGNPVNGVDPMGLSFWGTVLGTTSVATAVLGVIATTAGAEGLGLGLDAISVGAGLGAILIDKNECLTKQNWDACKGVALGIIGVGLTGAGEIVAELGAGSQLAQLVAVLTKLGGAGATAASLLGEAEAQAVENGSGQTGSIGGITTTPCGTLTWQGNRWWWTGSQVPPDWLTGGGISWSKGTNGTWNGIE